MVKFQAETLPRVKKDIINLKSCTFFRQFDFSLHRTHFFVSVLNGFDRTITFVLISMTHCQSQSTPNWIKINWLPHSLFRYTTIDRLLCLVFFFGGFNVGYNQRQRLQCVLKWCGRRIIFTASHIKRDCQILYRSSICDANEKWTKKWKGSHSATEWT